MAHRDLTRGDILNISREFNLVHKLEALQYSYNDDEANESDLVKTWLRLIGGDGFATNDLTLADLKLLDSITGDPIEAKVKELTEIKEVTPPTTEELSIDKSSQAKTLILAFTTSPSKAIKVQVMQRFGNDAENLTEWHEVSSFVNVRYAQGREDGKPYTCSVPECTAVVRELKLVSPEQIGMSAN